MNGARQRLRDNILKRGALFFVLVWGMLFFGEGRSLSTSASEFSLVTNC